MKLIFASLCFVFVYVSFISEAQSALQEEAPLVRVRILSLPQAVQISGIGLQFQNLKKPYKPVAIPQNARAEVRILEKEGKRLWALRVNNKDPEHLFSEKYLLVRGEQLRIGTKSLPPHVLLAKGQSNKLDVVGVLSLDDYLVGVLSSEMPLSWPLETLKAQAVAARSYALSVMQERRDQPFHLESSILDQVFDHVLDHNEENPLIKKAMQAVRETKGLELYGHDNRVLKAFFHSDCGGRTTSPQNVWKAGVNSGTTVDTSCPTSPKAHWKLMLTQEELSRRLKVNKIEKIELLQVPSEKRIKSVRIVLDNSAVKVMSINEFRQRVGFQELRSSIFELNRQGSIFSFEGQGFGHGVGLCQWGSRALGVRGHSFKSILRHYYPLARLK